MIDRSDTERLVRSWLEPGPTSMPDRVVDVVADRISRQRQRRHWRLPWRLPMTNQMKVLVGLAAVLVIAFTGWSILPRQGGIGGPGPSPGLSPSPSPAISPSPRAAACSDPNFQCAGPLSVGEHSSVAFKPAMTFRVPEGWYNNLDRDRSYTFVAPGNTLSLAVYSQVAIPEQNATCTAARKAGVGSTVADWVTFLTKHPGLVASAATPVTVGPFSGMRVTVHVGRGWTKTCPNSIAPAAYLITDNGPTPTRVYWIDDQYTTFTLVDVAGETVIIAMQSAPSDVANTADQELIRPILESIRFNPTS
jgi:hypothetical protein